MERADPVITFQAHESPCLIAVPPQPQNVCDGCPYQLIVTFDNGEKRRFDVKPYIKGSWYGNLKDPGYFSTVSVNGYTVEWPKGQDLCPDELYYNSICPSSFIKSVKFNKSLQRRNISRRPKRWAERQPVRMKSPRGTGVPAKQSGSRYRAVGTGSLIVLQRPRRHALWRVADFSGRIENGRSKCVR